MDLETPSAIPAEKRLEEMAFLKRRNEEHLAAHPGDTMLEARIRAYELAARMQMSLPEATSIESEPAHIRTLYGLESAVTEGFGRNCPLARRLLERDVRGRARGHRGEPHQAGGDSRSAAGWIAGGSQAAGMVADTLVVFNTEFGRTPITQGIGEKRAGPPSERIHVLAGWRRFAGGKFVWSER